MLLTGRTWTVAAIVLAVTAIGLECAAKCHDGLGMMAVARAAQENHRKDVHTVVARHRGQSALWGRLGVVSALLAVGCWVTAQITREPGPHGPFVVVIVAYVVWCLVLF